jgi:hypothetical protein
LFIGVAGCRRRGSGWVPAPASSGPSMMGTPRRRRTGLYVLTLAGDRICALTRFDTGVLPWFALPGSLPSR